MVQSTLPEEIDSELALARESMIEGNEGKARVCARRAVAKAFLLSSFSKGVERSISAMESLRIISRLETLPEQVRDAARNLSVGVTENRPMSRQPADDASLIVKTLLGSQ